MKTNVLVVVTVSLLILTSCGSKSGHIIGSFEVIKKVSAKEITYDKNPATDYGYVYLVSSHGDTIKSLVSSSEVYLNTKVRDIVLVSQKNKLSPYTINNRVKRFQIGYCKVISKISDEEGFVVVSRGEDTIRVSRVSGTAYFSTGINDSVFVKKDRGISTYYVE